MVDIFIIFRYSTFIGYKLRLFRVNVLAWILGVSSKQLTLLRGFGAVLAASIVVNSLSPQVSELVKDAIASWCGDIVGHFLLIRNGVEKLV